MRSWCVANGKFIDGDYLPVLDIIRFLFSHPLTRQSKFKAFLRFIVWQIKSRLGDEFIVTWIGGTKLAVRHGMTGATGNIYVGIHEFTDMLFLLHFLRPNDLFLDVGANVGSYTVLASGVCGARTWAFEPDPVTTKRLRKNIEINAIGKLATIHEVALGPNETDVAFTIGRDTMNRVADPGDRNVRIVRQRRLDEILDGRAPTMVKLDVEGYEDEVLKGADASLSNKSLMAIQAESVSEFFGKTLDRHGFRRVYYDPYQRALSSEPTDYPSSNALFVKDEESVAARLREAPPVCVLDQSI